MRVNGAKALARQWVAGEAAALPGFAGAYFAGSITWLPDDAMLPPTSDVDLWVALDGPELPEKHGKLLYRGLILDVSYRSLDSLPSAEGILADHQVAGGFSTANVIADPTGRLTALQAAVSRDYAKRVWVEKRCAHARDHALRYVGAFNEAQPFHDQALFWLFATGVTTHVLLVAGLRNPTVRRRYAAVRELLADYGRLEFYETLLEMLGCAAMTRARAGQHLDPLADAFDDAAVALRTPVVFAGDLTANARLIAIDGSRELIEQGLHREAVFWIAVTYSRCQKILYDDAPELHDEHNSGFRALLADLGIDSSADLQQRTARVAELLPRVWEVAKAIMTANPQIQDKEV